MVHINIYCIQPVTAVWKCSQTFLVLRSEGCRSVHQDFQTSRTCSEVYPGTSSAHRLCTTVFPCGVLWGRCEQQLPPGSCSQKTSTRIQMAHSVGICKTSTVCSYWSCCGMLKSTHLNVDTAISKTDISKLGLFCLLSLLSQQLSWTLKSLWCLGIWWMSWHNTWENIQGIISKRSAALQWSYLHCMLSR